MHPPAEGGGKMDLRAAELVCGKIGRVEKDLKRVPALVFETIKAYEARATIRK